MFPQCRALVIHCIDFRFISAIREFLIERGLKDNYDLVSLAGAGKGLAGDDPAGSEILSRQLKIATQFHGIKEVYIIHHLECLAYRNQYQFESIDAEISRLKEDMEKVKCTILMEYPYLQVMKILAIPNQKLEIIP